MYKQACGGEDLGCAPCVCQGKGAGRRKVQAGGGKGCGSLVNARGGVAIEMVGHGNRLAAAAEEGCDAVFMSTGRGIRIQEEEVARCAHLAAIAVDAEADGELQLARGVRHNLIQTRDGSDRFWRGIG